jgi:hypothetical protein
MYVQSVLVTQPFHNSKLQTIPDLRNFRLYLYVDRSNLNENLIPFQAQINLYERACADKL